MDNKHKFNSLLEADDSVLVVIDVQDVFLNKLPHEQSSQLLENVCWLARLANWRQIPLIVTAEQLPKNPLSEKLASSLTKDIPVFDKLTFGLTYQATILDAVEQTNRKTAVLVGLETDVCVMHSAIGLLEQGYRVAMIADATGAPDPGQEIGLQRMQSAGVSILSAKGLFYEWLRTVESVERFHQENPDMRDLAKFAL